MLRTCGSASRLCWAGSISGTTLSRGMRPLGAHCHLGLGKVHHRTGKRQQAQEHLTTATAMHREMDMPFSLDQAAAELISLS